MLDRTYGLTPFLILGLVFVQACDKKPNRPKRTSAQDERDKSLGHDDGFADSCAGLPRSYARHERPEATFDAEYGDRSGGTDFPGVSGQNRYQEGYDTGWEQGALERFKQTSWPYCPKYIVKTSDCILKVCKARINDETKVEIGFVDKENRGWFWEYNVPTAEALLINGNGALEAKYGIKPTK